MCIILIKPKGKELPSKEIFRKCYTNNPDGCGYMYVENNEVVVKKGYMGYKNMYKELKKLGNDKGIVVHFRIGTSGNKDQKTCHPYPLSADVKDLQTTHYTTDVAMVHNGIITGYSDLSNNNLNDTQVFIRDFLSVLKDLDNEFYKNIKVQKMLKEITNSKLTFMNNKEEIFCVGDFIEDDGILYSNTTYKTSYWSTYNWDKYYDERTKTYRYKDNDDYEDEADIYYGSKSENALINYKDKENDNYREEDDINYDNYVVIEPGYIVGTINDMMEIEYPDTYGIDDLGNFFTLQTNGFPRTMVWREATLYTPQYEEVII